jgi:hypothetical protein
MPSLNLATGRGAAIETEVPQWHRHQCVHWSLRIYCALAAFCDPYLLWHRADGRGDARERLGEVAAEAFDVRWAEEDEDEEGTKVTQILSSAPVMAATQGSRSPGLR